MFKREFVVAPAGVRGFIRAAPFRAFAGDDILLEISLLLKFDQQPMRIRQGLTGIKKGLNRVSDSLASLVAGRPPHQRFSGLSARESPKRTFSHHSANHPTPYMHPPIRTRRIILRLNSVPQLMDSWLKKQSEGGLWS